ncbi:MAG: hypothetical protein LBC73_08555 [Oscillospiraceae bacterium]|jgi:hypothetical protein|nr:hypothetical protein [Oscillospiraceae bacterium]
MKQKTQTEMNTKRKTKLRIITITLCFVLFLSTTLTIVFALVQTFTSPGTISTMISDIDSAVLMQEYDVYKLAVEHVGQDIIDEFGLNPETIENLMEQQFVDDFLSNTLVDYIDELSKGNENHSISIEDVLSILEDNITEIESVTGHQLTTENLENIEIFLYDSDIVETISISSIINNTQADLALVQRVLSPFTLLIPLILALLTIAVILFLNRKHLLLAIKDIGITLGIVGVIYTLLGLLLNTLLSIAVGDTSVQSLVNSLITQPRSIIITYGVITLVIGILLITASIVTRVIKLKHTQIST